VISASVNEAAVNAEWRSNSAPVGWSAPTRMLVSTNVIWRGSTMTLRKLWRGVQCDTELCRRTGIYLLSQPAGSQ